MLYISARLLQIWKTCGNKELKIWKKGGIYRKLFCITLKTQLSPPKSMINYREGHWMFTWNSLIVRRPGCEWWGYQTILSSTQDKKHKSNATGNDEATNCEGKQKWRYRVEIKMSFFHTHGLNFKSGLFVRKCTA